MIDLAPSIIRQRLIIEGYSDFIIESEHICLYLKGLCKKADMIALTEPITHKSSMYGWAGWMHWETSGVHLYAWDDLLFFSVDIYTCKYFDVEKVIGYTKDFFKTSQLVYQEITSGR